MEILKLANVESSEHRILEVSGVNLLPTSDEDWTVPYTFLFKCILRQGGTLLIWDVEEGKQFFDSRIGSTIKGLAFYSLGGWLQELRRDQVSRNVSRTLKVDEVDLIPKNDLEQTILRDSWLGLWSATSCDLRIVKSFEYSGDGEFSDEALQWLAYVYDVVVLAVKDGNPIYFYVSQRGAEVVKGWVNEVNHAISQLPWVIQNFNDLKWDDEYATWVEEE